MRPRGDSEFGRWLASQPCMVKVVRLRIKLINLSTQVIAAHGYKNFASVQSLLG
jgi:hypothetical protein